jgi:TPP-dependent pyruvate/acetoin dehydrogenase alpha subunit
MRQLRHFEATLSAVGPKRRGVPRPGTEALVVGTALASDGAVLWPTERAYAFALARGAGGGPVAARLLDEERTGVDVVRRVREAVQAHARLHARNVRVCVVGDDVGDAAALAAVVLDALAGGVPIVFVCETNLRAARSDDAPALVDRARDAGVVVDEVDGTDVDAVQRAVQHAIAEAQATAEPRVVEVLTLRRATAGARALDDVQGDPLACFAERLRANGTVSEAALREMELRADGEALAMATLVLLAGSRADARRLRDEGPELTLGATELDAAGEELGDEDTAASGLRRLDAATSALLRGR